MPDIPGKALIRAEMKSKRLKLSEQEAADSGKRIIDNAIGLVDSGFYIKIHTFLPVRKFREINTFLLIEYILKNHPGIKLFTSVTDLDNPILRHVPIHRDTVFTENKWGIPEPQNPAIFTKDNDFDLVLVPMLAFDNKGHRIGYGKGYYDRFLSLLLPQCMKAGLCYGWGEIDEIQAETADIALNAVITEDGILGF